MYSDYTVNLQTFLLEIDFTVQFDLSPQKIYVVEKSCMLLTSISHGYVSHQIDSTSFPAFSIWKASEWVAQLTHRLNLPLRHRAQRAVGSLS